MTLQEIFDKVAARLRDGTGCAMTDRGMCYYWREGSPLRCAIGALVSDELAYDLQMCGIGSIDNVLKVTSLRAALSRELDTTLTDVIANAESGPRLVIDLLSRIQMTHDEPDNWDEKSFGPDGEAELQGIAADFGLTYTAPGEAEQ